jgi:putative cardiolipin synthase
MDQTATDDSFDSTFLARTTHALAAGHDGESGFLLLDRGRDALSWRLILADAAELSIDAQYFLWKDDDAGKVMIQRLLDAAERGVRVRVLIDDSMTESDPHYLALFGAHPNVQVRIYKPFGPEHKSFVLRWLDYLADWKVANHRMHNKLFLVDRAAAIVGGRNIANEYFEYPGPFVFRSRDLLAIGPVTTPAASAFELYWNSSWAIPIESVVAPLPTAEAAIDEQKSLDAFATDASHYPTGFFDDPRNVDGEMARLGNELLWGKATLLLDAVPEGDGSSQTHEELDRTGRTLARVASEATDEIIIQSAYLILLKGGFEELDAIHQKGVNIKLSTNSLASNNHLSSFAAYRPQRKKMLGIGAELYEMRPDAMSERAQFTDAELEEHKTKFGLHAKTSVFDRKVTFVGSFNLDPRSVNLNTEMGLLVESEALARQVAESIENDMAGGNSWQVVENDRGKLSWLTVQDGVTTDETDTEPMTTAAQREAARVLSLVPDKAQM